MAVWKKLKKAGLFLIGLLGAVIGFLFGTRLKKSDCLENVVDVLKGESSERFSSKAEEKAEQAYNQAKARIGGADAVRLCEQYDSFCDTVWEGKQRIEKRARETLERRRGE